VTTLRILTADDKLAEIRRLYFETREQTIQQDLAKAVGLLKSMETEDERERATVYMDGLAQMRSDWAKRARPPRTTKASGKKRPAGKPKAAGKHRR
jgi:hypothetical protein